MNLCIDWITLASAGVIMAKPESKLEIKAKHSNSIQFRLQVKAAKRFTLVVKCSLTHTHAKAKQTHRMSQMSETSERLSMISNPKQMCVNESECRERHGELFFLLLFFHINIGTAEYSIIHKFERSSTHAHTSACESTHTHSHSHTQSR